MDLTSNIIINTFSILILIIINTHSRKIYANDSLQNKLFSLMMDVTILILICDIFSRFDGHPNSFYPLLNQSGNFLVFILSPILPSLWLFYVYVEVFQEGLKSRRLIIPVIALNAIHAVIVIMTPFFGWLYSIDPENIYHRGPLYLLSPTFTLVLILAAFFMIILNRAKIERKHFFSLVFFAIPPSICIFLQIIFYGISMILNSLVLSILMVHLKIQSHGVYTDHLTGLNNRKMLDYYLKDKIDASKESRTFSAIMLDVNDFKLINDTYGHKIGDEVLELIARLLKNSLRTSDFISRFGGDEFCIILDVQEMDTLQAMVDRIHHSLEMYNETSAQPYQISVSAGYAIYDRQSNMTADNFQKQIDALMYADKRAKMNA